MGLVEAFDEKRLIVSQTNSRRMYHLRGRMEKSVEMFIGEVDRDIKISCHWQNKDDKDSKKQKWIGNGTRVEEPSR